MKFICLLAFLSVAYASRNEANRNMLHYSPASGWQGPPAALVASPDGTLRVYYEQPFETNETVLSGATKMQWGVASTNDGISWTDNDRFLYDEGNAGTVDLPNATFLQGGALPNPLKDVTKQNLVYLSHAIYSSKDGKKKEDHIDVRWSNDGLKSTTTKYKLKLKATGAAPFQLGGDLYVAIVDESTKKCIVNFNKITAAGNFIKELTSTPSGSYTLSSKRPCRGVQIGQLGEVFVISASLSSSTKATMKALYIVGELNLQEGGKLEVENIAAEGFLDYGDDAQDFKFAQFKGQLVAIGWNGNALYQDGYPTTAWKNGMTVLRTLSSVHNERLIQSPFDFSNLKLKEINTEGPKTIDTEDCNTELDLSQLESDKDGVFIFDLVFFDKDNFQTKGFNIAFIADGEAGEEVLVSFRGAKKEYSVNRAKTVEFPGSKDSKISAADLSKDAPESSTQKVKIILDKTVVEVYGNDGEVVLTESFFLSEGKSFQKVCLSAFGGDLLLPASKYGKYNTMWSYATTTTPTPTTSNGPLLRLSAATAIISASLLA